MISIINKWRRFQKKCYDVSSENRWFENIIRRKVKQVWIKNLKIKCWKTRVWWTKFAQKSRIRNLNSLIKTVNRIL